MNHGKLNSQTFFSTIVILPLKPEAFVLVRKNEIFNNKQSKCHQLSVSEKPFLINVRIL